MSAAISNKAKKTLNGDGLIARKVATAVRRQEKLSRDHEPNFNRMKFKTSK